METCKTFKTFVISSFSVCVLGVVLSSFSIENGEYTRKNQLKSKETTAMKFYSKVVFSTNLNRQC